MSERTETVPTHWSEIFIAGDLDDARRVCRAYCMRAGLCVTVEPVEYIYTGGAEAGVRIGLINYPRFPSTPDELWRKAEELARELAAALHQWSVMISSAEQTIWITTRGESQ